MKKTLILFTSFILCICVSSFAQDGLGDLFGGSLPETQLKDLNGKTINTAKLTNDGKPIIISFWATWCTPCKNELNTIQELYEDWQEETGVKLVAVSVDDQRTASRVTPYVDSRGWEYEILLDPNSDFKRAMGVNNIPHTFLVNGEGKIVYSHNNYAPGDENNLYEHLLKISQEKK
ncbi:MAG: TlpA family protein disulfide reductase [Brumimicrobium sp.]|nr:TlpA family protein disulfide reductase [Brumimicrobium sp.]MCO5267345.1 TlpA family protein disulfide reductase [Brumimicrobium sp.]